MKYLIGVAACLLAGAAAAQTVSMSGRLGDKALLMIDGNPRTVAVGSTVQGVKLISVTADSALVELNQKRVTLPLGGAQVNLGVVAAGETGSRIVLTAGSGGHFVTGGTIDGKTVMFMVDTGATTIALSQAEAEHIGLQYQNGQRGMVSTANGPIPVHRVLLNSVRIGEVQVYNIEAMVVPMPMPYVLLGNSFLTRFQMKRDNDVMTLERKP